MRTDIVLGHGWTLDYVEKMCAAIGRSYHTYGLCDARDIRQAAYDALIETLYDPETVELSPKDGWQAAMRGARRWDLAERRHRGRDHDTWTKESYGHVVYTFDRRYAPAPDVKVLDALALRQCWPKLRPVDAEAIVAWAVHDSREAAAAALGLKRSTFNLRLQQAKERFWRAWFDHEPVPRFGHDRKPSPPSGDGALDAAREKGRQKNWRRRGSTAAAERAAS